MTRKCSSELLYDLLCLIVSSCKKTVELHIKRHRAIAVLLQAIQSFDSNHDLASPIFNKKRKERQREGWNYFEVDAYSQAELKDDEISWNDSSTMNDDETDKRMRLETPDEKKAAKTERKTAKNQARFNIITEADLRRVEEALHPERIPLADKTSEVQNSQGLGNNTTIEDNITFNTHTFKYTSLRPNIYQKKIAKNNGTLRNLAATTPQQEDNLMQSFLLQLGISCNSSGSTRERKTLVMKLRTSITDDLRAYENEQKETMQRMAGYWRYANRNTYNCMVQQNEIWDWATGEKLPEIELDDIQEEDEEADRDTVDRSTDVATPSEGHVADRWDGDYELPEKPMTLSSSNRLEMHVEGTPSKTIRIRKNADGGNIATPTKASNSTLLTYSPGRSPGPTLTFTVPSPSSSEDSDNSEDDKENENDKEVPNNPVAVRLRAFAEDSPETPIQATFTHKADTRTNGFTIRPASPLKATISIGRTWASSRFPKATRAGRCEDSNNSFGVLENNTPAPKDNIELTPEEEPFIPTKATAKAAAVEAELTIPLPGKTAQLKMTVPVLTAKKAVTKSLKLTAAEVSNSSSAKKSVRGKENKMSMDDDDGWSTVRKGGRR